MYAALQINEILREIFIHIHKDEDSHKTAYHAAFVCKQFSPHALDVLWFSLDTLVPLIALIPSSITTPDLVSVVSRLSNQANEVLGVSLLYCCSNKG